MNLSDVACRNAKPSDRPQKLTDGKGLYLFVTPSGSKLWRVDYSHAGKRKTASLGKYPRVGLAEARAQRDKIRAALEEGRDPSLEVIEHTLESVARQWYATNLPRWKTNYSTRFWRQVERDILSTLGTKRIDKIEPIEILDALRAIEGREAVYTAHRIHRMVNLIFKFAVVSGLIKHNPAADLHVALKPTPKEKHRAALRLGDLPDFFRRLNVYDGERQTAQAIRAIVHTFVRTNEIRFARWNEFDGDVWRIPGERMKMGKEHIVPLSRQAREVFRELRELARGSEWVLPGSTLVSKPISENTMLYALYRMGLHGRSTIHGFRSTASTILNESGLFQADAIERQLAHVPANQVRSAYNAALYLGERVRMMQWYSDLLDKQEGEGCKGNLSELLE